jgi:hypothetical protein
MSKLTSTLGLVFSIFLLLYQANIAQAQGQDFEALYRQQLSTYRASFDTTSVSLQQYANLRTLASQEEAVQAMRNFLLIRSDVLSTHFSILGQSLSDQKLDDPLWVASVSGKISTTLEDLKQHHSRSDIAVDRIRADQEALWLIGQEPRMKAVADRAQCLIGIGKVKQATAYLETVKQKVDDWIASAPISETQRVEKRRGSDELGRTIEESKATLDIVLKLYAQNGLSDDSSLVYPQIRANIITSYTSLVRGIDFAKELTQ